MWAGVSVFLSPNLKVGLEEQVREALTINGASISHKFRPGKDIYILEKFDSVSIIFCSLFTSKYKLELIFFHRMGSFFNYIKL